jgi:MFS transporter, DHA1 family, inner membrane transport protein
MAAETSIRKERWYVVILSAIQIAHILDFVIIMPLGPRFMKVFGINPTEFSSLVSAYTLSAGIVGFFGALYADHFDRKKFLLFNFTGFILGTFLCAIAPNFYYLLIARIVAGAFGGVLNASVLSLLADLIPFERRGAAMGVVMSSFSIASVLGVPLGLYATQIFDWHAAFYMIVVIGIIFWILSYTILPSVHARSEKLDLKDNLKSFKSIISQPDYLQSFLLTSVLGFGIFMVVPFISPYMVGNVGLTEKDLPFIYLAGGACTIISARIIGRACDRLGSFRVFRVVALISVIPIFIMTNLPQVHLFLALTSTSFFMMTGSGRFIPAMTIISAVVKPQERGTFMGLENAARQLSSGLASQMAGLIIGAGAAGALTNYHIAGYISIFTSLVAVVIASHLKNKFHLR